MAVRRWWRRWRRWRQSSSSTWRAIDSNKLDAALALSLLLPDSCRYWKWPLFGLYLLLSWRLAKNVLAHRWVLWIVGDPATRVAHGLEHATIAVLADGFLLVQHGFTHGRDRFVVALDARQGDQRAALRDAATTAMRRILAGERALAYAAGCGTSHLVAAVSLWVIYVASVVFALAVGGSLAVFIPIAIVVFQMWRASVIALGLLAQRLYTVSTGFTAGTVDTVGAVDSVAGWRCPADETWYEVVVHVQLAATRGGLVAV
jgi:hypothetical protein